MRLFFSSSKLKEFFIGRRYSQHSYGWSLEVIRDISVLRRISEFRLSISNSEEYFESGRVVIQVFIFPVEVKYCVCIVQYTFRREMDEILQILRKILINQKHNTLHFEQSSYLHSLF